MNEERNEEKEQMSFLDFHLKMFHVMIITTTLFMITVTGNLLTKYSVVWLIGVAVYEISIR